MTNRPFADGVEHYALAGWPCILPVPVATKSPPPEGFSGAEGRDTDARQLAIWAGSHGASSIALRLPDGVIGIDVDHYPKVKKLPDGSIHVVDKRGGDTLAEHEAKWGPLPPTWRSSARELPSGIRFYRVPPGRYATKLGDAIEIIQRHHRYAVVWPSHNPDADGAAYGWTGPDGQAWVAPPRLDALPWLPPAWVQGLAEGAATAGPLAADYASGQQLLWALLDNKAPACVEMHEAGTVAVRELLASEHGSRHDVTMARVHRIVMAGAHGHPGTGEMLALLRVQWDDLTAGENRSDEWERMLLGSARKAVTALGGSAVPVDRDPCLMTSGQLWTAPAPAVSPDGAPIAAPAPARHWSVRELIGAQPFDVRSNLDHDLSAHALARMWPVLRYAADAGTWLLRGPDRWETRGQLGAWAVHELAELMPRGNPDAPKESEDFLASARRKRMMSTAGRNGVATTMAAAVAAGTHPVSLLLSNLDADPRILWAGGLPFDLKASADRPTLAQLDPNTPHLRTAALAPADVPTPRWDAFLAQVWPDPELRAWALRVLSIAFTGYSDKALPVMVGLRDRGKTQVVHLLMSVLGSYAISADPRLLSGADNAHASIIYALMGRRLAFIDEGPREGRWAQERLKQLTGGGQLTGNEMRRDPVTFNPSHTLVLTANDEPPLTDPAVRTRVRLIPCDGDVDGVRAARQAIGDTDGPAWLAEAPGVLWQMIKEAGRWLADRDSASTDRAPLDVRFRADAIAAEQDLVGQWLTEMCEPYEPGTKAGLLHEQFVAWCRGQGIRDGARPSPTKWGRQLTDLGYPPEHRRDGKYRLLRVSVGGALGILPTQPAPGGAAQPPSAPVTGWPAPVTGSVTGLEDNPSPSISAGQTPDLGGSVTGVTSSLRSITTTSITPIKKPIEKNIGVKPEVSQTRHTGGSETGGLPRSDGNSGPNPNPSQPGNPSQPPEQAQPAPQPTTARDTKAQAKAAAKAAQVAELAGPSYSLPAVVDRAGVIMTPPIDRVPAVLADLVAGSGALTVDIESSGYPLGHALYALRTVQLGDETVAVVLDPSQPAHARVIREALATAPRLHAHSAQADLVPLVHAGLADESIWERMHDTVIPAKLADPSSTGSDPGLKQLAGVVLGSDAVAPAADAARAALFKAHGWLTDTKVTTEPERNGWASVDSGCATMVRYAASDVLDTAALAKRLPALPDELLERERAVQRITARVSHRGVRIDAQRVAELQAEHTPQMAEAAAKMAALGVTEPGSDKQLAERLGALGVGLPRTAPSKRFPQGQPSVAAGVLEGLHGLSGAAGELVKATLGYRHHETVLSTFLAPYDALCRYGDGRARPTVYTLGTDTGRMSCVRPNLQQVPRSGGVRSCITADPGHVLISADFSGVEIRVMAALSQDPELVRMLAEGSVAEGLVAAGLMSKEDWQRRYDLHSMVAAQAFGPEFTKADRYTAKRGVFGWAYGGGIPSLARQIGVSESIMAAVVDSLQLVAPTYVAWAKEVQRQVRAGFTAMPTYSGRVIHLTRNTPHKAPNYCIQGTARELLVDALLRWDQTRWGGGVVLPVHDEIVAMVPETEADEALAALVECMSTELYGVKIKAEASTPSYSWRDST